MKKRNSYKTIRVVLLIALLISFRVNTAFAGEVVASLFTDESSKSTSTIGNTSGNFTMVGAVADSSKYNVEYVLFYGKDSSDISKIKAQFSYNSSSAFVNDYSISRTNYTVAKGTMYGNKMSNPKKECIASLVLKNS